MAPYEALYGRPCRSPLCWTEVGECSITGPDLIRDTSEKVNLIRQRLLTAQSWQKSYADVRCRPLEFEVGDHVFLKVMPKRGVVRFDKRGKLSPRFIGPFEILERVGTVAYRLALPPSMSGVHEVSKEFEIKSKKGKERREKNIYTHKVSRKGYAGLQEELVSLIILFYLIGLLPL